MGVWVCLKRIELGFILGVKACGNLDTKEDRILCFSLSRDSGAYQHLSLGAAAEEDAKSLTCNKNKHSTIEGAPEG